MQITNIRPLSEVLLVIDGAHKSSRLGPVWTMVLLMSRPWVVLPVKGPRATQLRSTCPDEEDAAALHDSQDLKVSKERWWLLTCLKKANLGPLSPGYLEKTGESTAAVPLMRVSQKERRQVWAFPSARFKRHSLWAWWAGAGMEVSQGLQKPNTEHLSRFSQWEREDRHTPLKRMTLEAVFTPKEQSPIPVTGRRSSLVVALQNGLSYS